MSAALFLVANTSVRKYIYVTVVTVFVIVSLPVLAVFSIGTSALSFLSHTTEPTLYSSTQTIGLYQGPPVPGDYYAWGNCTYWVYYLRQQAGDPIPTNWGNAATWAFYASLQGYKVDHNPSPGAIMQTADAAGGLGHVAYVIGADGQTGSWTISEMNVQGLDIVDQRTLPSTYAIEYNFIHDK